MNEVLNAIYERRSIRQYQYTEITTEEITELIKAAQMSPSWKNSQTARFYVAHSDEARAKIVDCLPDFNKERAEKARARRKRRKGMSELARINQLAKAAGMTYGRYVELETRAMVRVERSKA